MTDAVMESIRSTLATASDAPTFTGDLPEGTLECIALRPTDGYPSTAYFGMASTLEPLIEVLFRAKQYETGQAWLTEAVKALDKYSDPAAGLAQCSVTGSPGYLGRNIDGFGEWHMILHVSITNY